MADVINLERAPRPEFTDRQISFAKKLIGIGLARLTIASLVLGIDSPSLNHAQITSSNRMISKAYKELGYTITDARHGASPQTAAAINACARELRVRVRIA